MKRVIALDLLRGLAAWTVATPHFFIYRATQADTCEIIATMGVEIFFVLSGYVLASQIIFCISGSEPKIYLLFLIRRWMRTVPAYVVALLIISILFEELGSPDFFRYLGYAQNLLWQSNRSDYFSVAWSLSIEEWFYVLFPGFLLVGATVTKTKSVNSILAIALMFVAVIAATRFSFGDLGNWGAAVRRVVIYRVDSIAYGFLLYVLIVHLFPRYFDKLTFGAVGAFFCISSALTFFATAAIANNDSTLAKQLFPWLAALFGSSCIMWALKSDRFVTSRPWLVQISVFGGQISYSVYLFHMIFLTVLSPTDEFLPIALGLVVYVVTLVLFTTVFYRTFERPILHARPRLSGE